MLVNGKHYQTIWFENNEVKMINQLLLPHKFKIETYTNYEEIHTAIKTMVIRGSGAIGAAGACGMALAALNFKGNDLNKFFVHMEKAKKFLATARPTAYDLFYSLDFIEREIITSKNVAEAKVKAVESAKKYLAMRIEDCKKIGELGAELIEDGFKINTHCNAGWLAMVDWGTALAPIYVAKRMDKKIFVWVDETGPRNQGSKLTAWELINEKISFKIIDDNTTGFLMQRGEIDLVIVGADRIAANGDVANKIGTYSSAVLARENGIPFYVAAMTTSIDQNCPSGEDIPIEERDQEEVLFKTGLTEKGKIEKIRTSAEGSQALNLAFDITPAKYIKGIITERGIVKASVRGIKSLFEYT